MTDLSLVRTFAEIIYQGHHFSMQFTLLFNQHYRDLANQFQLSPTSDINHFIDQFRQIYSDDQAVIDLISEFLATIVLGHQELDPILAQMSTLSQDDLNFVCNELQLVPNLTPSQILETIRYDVWFNHRVILSFFAHYNQYTYLELFLSTRSRDPRDIQADFMGSLATSPKANLKTFEIVMRHVGRITFRSFYAIVGDPESQYPVREDQIVDCRDKIAKMANAMLVKDLDIAIKQCSGIGAWFVPILRENRESRRRKRH